jgi:branched-chain amino acid transport system substrate-binding protein
MFKRLLLAAGLATGVMPLTALAADPIKIGVTTILSGQYADRGQSEQYGIELALARINLAGGVLGRPIEAVYGDNAADVTTGVHATQRLINTLHVPVLIGALWTPVTHAIMPLVQQAKVPLVIDISAGQDFVDESGEGGNPYVFKTIPSDLDLARGLVSWLKRQDVQSFAILADDTDFSRANAASLLRAAHEAGITVSESVVVPKGSTDLAPLLAHLAEAHPDRLLSVLGASTAAFFAAYEHSPLHIPISGRIDFAAATHAVSESFLASGGLAQLSGIVVFTPLSARPEVRDFVEAYEAKYGIMPTQRAFFAFEAANLVADAIRRAGTADPQAIRVALAASTMPSALGGDYKMDAHNHPHTPLLILGLKDGHVTILAETN